MRANFTVSCFEAITAIVFAAENDAYYTLIALQSDNCISICKCFTTKMMAYMPQALL
jgi:hypothetical protein